MGRQVEYGFKERIVNKIKNIDKRKIKSIYRAPFVSWWRIARVTNIIYDKSYDG